MIFQFWGATTEKIHGSVVGDNLCPEATLIATRPTANNDHDSGECRKKALNHFRSFLPLQVILQ